MIQNQRFNLSNILSAGQYSTFDLLHWVKNAHGPRQGKVLTIVFFSSPHFLDCFPFPSGSVFKERFMKTFNYIVFFRSLIDGSTHRKNNPASKNFAFQIIRPREGFFFFFLRSYSPSPFVATKNIRR